MPIAVIVTAFITFFIAVGVRQYAIPATKPPAVVITQSPAPTKSSIDAMPSVTLYPTESPKSGIRPTFTQGTPTPSQVRVATLTPTAIPFNTVTPTPNPDTQAPTFDYMTGPGEGTTVDFNSFCFPMKFSDASTPIMVRYGMDAQAPSDWSQNYAPCYTSVSNGAHMFMVQAKDAAGNATEYIKRSFIVQIANPSNQITLTPTPTSNQSQ